LETEKGHPVTHDDGSQVAHSAEAVDNPAMVNVTLGRGSRRRHRVSSTLKQAAQAAYSEVFCMFRDTRVTRLDADLPERQRVQHHRTRASFGGFDSALPVHTSGTLQAPQRHVQGGLHTRPPAYQHPRRGPVPGFRSMLEREERRRGRLLTPEEWQALRDWCIQRNRLKKMGLDYCFNGERQSHRRRRQ